MKTHSSIFSVEKAKERSLVLLYWNAEVCICDIGLTYYLFFAKVGKNLFCSIYATWCAFYVKVKRSVVQKNSGFSGFFSYL